MKGGAASGKTKYTEAEALPVTIPNLETGEIYKVWVRAENAVGKGERVHATIILPEPE